MIKCPGGQKREAVDEIASDISEIHDVMLETASAALILLFVFSIITLSFHVTAG